MIYNAKDLRYEKVVVFGKEGLFVEERINRNSIPEGFVAYEVRHDECLGKPVEIKNRIMVNFLGTLLVGEKFMEVEINGRKIIRDDEWKYIGSQSYTLKSYVKGNKER